jgi:hypothetical protein
MYNWQQTLNNKMSTNGIHKDWETLPPLKIPEEDDGLKPPKMQRCREKSLLTDEDYKIMENQLKYGKMDPTAMDYDEWEVVIQHQLERERRMEEAKAKKVAHL